MEILEARQIGTLVVKDIQNDLKTFSSGFPPPLRAKMDKLLEHVTNCKHDFEYSSQHILRWYKWICLNANSEEIRKAGILGWCHQFAATYLILFDDACDKSELRFGRPTWYNMYKNSSNLYFDIELVRCWSFFILNKYFNDHPLYAQLINILWSTLYDHLKGCRLELEFEFENLRNSSIPWEETVCMKNYSAINREKATAFHMYSQVAWAYTLAGYDINEHKEIYDNAKEICCLHGVLGQSLDDYWDCFSKAECMDETDSDIYRGQLSWLLVKTREICSKEQWNLIKEHYGRDDSKSVQIVKDIYLDVGIASVWEENKQTLLAEIHDTADKLFKPEHEIFKKVVLSWVDWTMEVCTG